MVCASPARGSGKMWQAYALPHERGLFREVHFLESLENLEIQEIPENPQAVENKENTTIF